MAALKAGIENAEYLPAQGHHSGKIQHDQQDHTCPDDELDRVMQFGMFHSPIHDSLLLIRNTYFAVSGRFQRFPYNITFPLTSSKYFHILKVLMSQLQNILKI
jgi:hypothetical protein